MSRGIGLSTMFCLGVLAAGTAAAGLEYSAVTKTDSDGQTTTTQTHAMIDGQQARIEFTESSNPAMRNGNYMLTRDAGTTMYMVDPSSKTYMRWGTEGMMGMAGAAMQMMNMKVSDPKVEKVSEEKGPDILGYPTRHIRYRTTYTMQTSFMGMKTVKDTVVDEDVWVTSKIGDMGAKAWAKFAQNGTGNAELDKLAHATKGKETGFQLKSIATTTSTDAKKRTSLSTTSMEVTELQEKDIPAKVFDIPPDYTEQVLGITAPPAETNTTEDVTTEEVVPEAAKQLMRRFMR